VLILITVPTIIVVVTVQVEHVPTAGVAIPEVLRILMHGARSMVDGIKLAADVSSNMRVVEMLMPLTITLEAVTMSDYGKLIQWTGHLALVVMLLVILLPILTVPSKSGAIIDPLDCGALVKSADVAKQPLKVYLLCNLVDLKIMLGLIDPITAKSFGSTS
jgi:hypothetical protein